MSRVGAKEVEFGSNVQVRLENDFFIAKGPKGEARVRLPKNIKVNIAGNKINVLPLHDKVQDKAFWGTGRSVIQGAITGVTNGVKIEMLLQGVGYKASVAGHKLILNVGFSHPVEYEFPKTVKITTPKPTELVIEGANPQEVGLIASQIRKIKVPEVYKGKGIRYVGEYVRIKEGKKK
jgi:large subunit ribosomal protein L6